MSFTNNQRLNGSAKPSGHQPSRTFRRNIPAFITGEPQAHSAPSGVLWLDTALRQARLDAHGRPATKKPPSQKQLHLNPTAAPHRMRQATAIPKSCIEPQHSRSPHFTVLERLQPLSSIATTRSIWTFDFATFDTDGRLKSESQKSSQQSLGTL
jgi:hypothetical protein